MNVVCSDCGTTVDKRGLANHQNGNFCKAESLACTYREKGYTSVHFKVAEAMKKRSLLNAFFQPELAPTTYHPGSRTRKGLFTNQGWIKNSKYFDILLELCDDYKCSYIEYDKLEKALYNMLLSELDKAEGLVKLKLQGVT